MGQQAGQGWDWRHCLVLLYVCTLAAAWAVFSMTSVLSAAFVCILSLGMLEGTVFAKKGEGQYHSLQDVYRWDEHGNVVLEKEKEKEKPFAARQPRA